MADCLRCGGACCETVTLNIEPTSADFGRFLELRSTPQPMSDGTVARNFKAPCLQLCAGRCAIYDDRPKICRDFEPGSVQCMQTVAALRSADELLAILKDHVVLSSRDIQQTVEPTS